MQTPRTVLVVDDDSFMRETLKLILHSENYQVIGEAGFVIKPLNAASVLDRIGKCFQYQ